MFKIRKTFSVVLIIVLMMTSMASYVSASDTIDYAVFVKKGITLTNANQVIGNTVVRDVTGETASYELNLINWGLAVSDGYKLYVEDPSKFTGYGYVSQVKYEGPVPSYVDLPSITFPEPEKKEFIKKAAVTITEDGWYSNFEVTTDSQTNVTIDTSDAKTIHIRADKLNINKEINIIGNGTVNFYTDELTSGHNANINPNNTGTVNIFVSKKKTNTTISNFKGNVNLYLSASSLIVSNDSNFQGNIYCGSNVTINHSGSVTGLVYAPNGLVKLTGTSQVIGKVIADKVKIEGSAKVTYGPASDNLGVLGVTEPTTKPTAEPTAEPTVAPTAEPTTTPEPTLPPDDLSELKFSHAYLYGYGWGDVGAEESLTKEEVSAIVYRLLKQNNRIGNFVKPEKATYSDLSRDSWSFSSIEYLASIGVFDKTASKIQPAAKINRGEAARIICLALGIDLVTDGEELFEDLPVGDKYYPYIMALVKKGVINGMGNANVEPYSVLKRAEFVKMVNILIGRGDRYDVSEAVNPYPDLKTNHWAYEHILRASYGFDKNFKIDPSKKLPREEIDYN